MGNAQSLITIIVVLIIIGFVIYLVETYIPLPGWIKTVIRFVAIIGVALWLLSFFGIVLF